LTVFIPFLRISNSYFKSFPHYIILYYFVDLTAENEINGKGSHDLILRMNDTKNCVIIFVILISINFIFVLLIYYIVIRK